jgi:hypothetical protein
MMFLLFAVVAADYTFVKYEPSPWEAQWTREITRWKDKECETMNLADHKTRALWSVYTSQTKNQFPKKNSKPAVVFNERDIYSRLIWKNQKNGTLVEQQIEPLVGLLRDPLTICAQLKANVGVFQPGESAMEAKRFLLPEKAMSNESVRYIVMDLGAGLFEGANDKHDTIGAKWFVDLYAKRGVTIDRLISFEDVQHSPEQIYRNVPPALMGKYVYINMPVSSDAASALNPWNVLLHTAKKQDYVIVKLDIDNSEIDRQLVLQLISNKSIHDVVDEFYFEHHVNSKEMNQYWGSHHGEHTIVQSYALFKNLRMLGVRAHSWP